MIILYATSCEGCAGNRAVNRVKQYCKQNGVKFEQRLTPLWKRFADEADAISKASGLKLPFMYGTKSQTVVEASTFTSGERIEKLVELEREFEETS